MAQALAGELDGVRAVRLARAGRGPGGGGPGGTGPGGARIPGGGTARGGTGAAGGPPRPVPRRHERDAPGGATGAQRLPAARGQAGGAEQITAWVRAHFTAEAVGGVIVYDLTRAR